MPLGSDLVKKSDPTTRYKDSNPYFDSYKKSFKDDYYTYSNGENVNLNFPVNFESDAYFDKRGGNSIGVCFSYKGRGIEVIIKKSYWDKMSDACKKTLIYHEFGHCGLDQDHRDGHPSVMNTYNNYCGLMEDHENMFLEELYLVTKDSVEYLKSI